MQRLPGAIFQEDNALTHMARVSQDCLRTVTTLPWPAQSPDFSPIEHIWDHFGRLNGYDIFPWLANSPDLNPIKQLWDLIGRDMKRRPLASNLVDLSSAVGLAW
ncbi:transposable element Tcb2 transposase [Trichonephila clavipes]|nr:transposable element Tcb2 transposase [Trichonephila clavipes]